MAGRESGTMGRNLIVLSPVWADSMRRAPRVWIPVANNSSSAVSEEVDLPLVIVQLELVARLLRAASISVSRGWLP